MHSNALKPIKDFQTFLTNSKAFRRRKRIEENRSKRIEERIEAFESVKKVWKSFF